MSARRLVLLGILAAATGCAGDGSRLGGDMTDQPPATLAQIQQDVFGAICINCHVTGGVAEFQILETARASYANLVGVPSVEIPRLLRVDPGHPDASYIVWKIEGQGPNGEAIVGERMPPPSAGEPALDPQQIANIRQWILEGAAP